MTLKHFRCLRGVSLFVTEPLIVFETRMEVVLVPQPQVCFLEITGSHQCGLKVSGCALWVLSFWWCDQFEAVVGIATLGAFLGHMCCSALWHALGQCTLPISWFQLRMVSGDQVCLSNPSWFLVWCGLDLEAECDHDFVVCVVPLAFAFEKACL